MTFFDWVLRNKSKFINNLTKFVRSYLVHMQFSHDKHQYYFEKYLRNEMKGEELALFENKLQTDSLFQESFEYYKKNRTEIVAEELAEYDEPEIMKKKPQSWGWVLAIFSLLALVLMIDFYASNFYQEQQRSSRKPLIDKINVFKNFPKRDVEGSEDLGLKSEKYKKPNLGLDEQNEDSALSNMTGKMEQDQSWIIEGDYFVFDSLFKVLENIQLSERINLLKNGIDTLQTDTTLEELARISFFSNPHLIARQLLVEYWDSPIHIRGYIFNGKKILLYGLDATANIYLTYSEVNKSYTIIINKQAYYLFPNGMFQKLAE